MAVTLMNYGLAFSPTSLNFLNYRFVSSFSVLSTVIQKNLIFKTQLGGA